MLLLQTMLSVLAITALGNEFERPPQFASKFAGISADDKFYEIPRGANIGPWDRAPGPSSIDVFNMSFAFNLDRADFYETIHLVSALQGIVNREGPQVYILYTQQDEAWLQYLLSDQNWLSNATVNNITTISQLIEKYQGLGYFNGAVVYDSDVPASSNLASTSAGAENLLPFCNRTSNTSDTLYQQFVLSGLLNVGRYINSSMFTGAITHSRKGDAYVWAINEFITSGLCDAAFQGYYIDYFWVTSSPCCGNAQTDYLMSTVSNHDFFISRRGFFWDLDVWPDEAPNDDPTQPPGTDLLVLQRLELAAYTRVANATMIHVGGFTPWAYKYVSPFGTHGGVQTEWQTVSVLSGYNVFVDADACCIAAMSNAAFYQHFPLNERYNSLPLPRQQDMIDNGYMSWDGKVANKAFAFWYAGDYDSAAWLYEMLQPRWADPMRGSIPIGWAIDGELSLRFPIMFDYVYQSRSSNDFFIEGDSGAGYLNPNGLFEPRYSNLSDGYDVWTQWNQNYYRQFGVSFSGFLINGYDQMTTEAKLSYVTYSVNGIVGQQDMVPPSTELLNETLPVMHEASDIVNVDVSQAVSIMCSYVQQGTTQFLMFRTILEYPSFMQQITQALQSSCPDLVIVDPHVAGFLARVHLGGNNDHIVAYLNDTFPRTATHASLVSASFTMRNDGWNVLQAGQVDDDAGSSGSYLLNVTLTSSSNQVEWSVPVSLSNNVLPGDVWSMSAQFSIPNVSGSYTLRYNMQTSDGEQFKSLWYQTAIAVV